MGSRSLRLTDRNLYTDSRLPRARRAFRAAATSCGSVQTHRLKLVFPRVGDRRVLGIGQHDRRPICAEQRKQGQSRTHLRGLREEAGDVFRGNRLHVSQRPIAILSELLRRQVWRHGRNCFAGFGSHCFTPHSAAASGPPFGRILQSRATICIFRTIRSGCGRTRSTHSSPCSSSALLTCIPSAKRNPRWNCRAAMPRCRYSRVFSSCCRPRIVSWLSSTVTSIWSCEKPATASVMRNFSGSLPTAAIRSILYGG